MAKPKSKFPAVQPLVVVCPRCGWRTFTPYENLERVVALAKKQLPFAVTSKEPSAPPALSRFDNETYVCSDCGGEEALAQFFDRK